MDDTALSEHISSTIQAFHKQLGPRLGDALSTLLAGSGANAASDPSRYLHLDAQPMARLPGWVASLPGVDLSDAQVGDLVTSGVLGYLHARVHDDWFDEDIGESGVVMTLATALLGAHCAFAAKAVGTHAPYHALCVERWAEYGEALLAERASWSSGSEPSSYDFDVILGRSRPLLLPAAGALAAGGAWHRLPQIAQAIDTFVRAHQLQDDLADAPADWARSRRTWAACESHHGPVSDPHYCLGTGWLRVTEQARDGLRLAAECARTAGLYMWAQQLDARTAQMA